MDDHLTWVIWLPRADVTSLYRGPGPAPSEPLIENAIVLVDAQTGQVLDTLTGP